MAVSVPSIRVQAELELRRRRAAGERAAEPKPTLPFPRWVDKYRLIQDRMTREVGPFSLRDYPWMADLYEVVGTLEPGLEIRVRKAAQMGLTEWAVNLAFYAIDELGARVFYALPPSQNVVGDFAHDRVDPAIAVTQRLQSIAGSTDNVGLKTFKRGALYLRATSVPPGRPDKAPQLSSVPADVAIIDEWDRVPPAAVPLIHDRMGDSHIKAFIGLSTPTFPGLGIDTEYAQTDQREPQIQCDHCGGWHWLDWTLVHSENGHVGVFCPNDACRQEMDRANAWAEGRMRFVPRKPEQDVIGYWISKLVSPRVDLQELWDRSRSTDTEQILAFWNNDLGLAFEPAGSRLNLELLRACVEDYEMPDTATWTAMGVDVGYTLYVYIVQPLPEGKHRALHIDAVPSWEDLDRLMRRYGVACCVVDDGPELTADLAFAHRWRGKAFLANYVHDMAGSDWCTFDLKRQAVRIDRDSGLDKSHGNIEGMWDELPRDFEMIPEFVDHMCVNVKVRDKRPDGTERWTFPRQSRPDHYDHARVYALAALERLRKLRPPLGAQEAGLDVPTAGPQRYVGYRGRL